MAWLRPWTPDPKIPGVEDDSYAACFFQRLQEFRSEGHLVDLTLCAEGKEIPCHRLVLSACTDYFHAMFRGGHPESTRDKIEMLGLNGEALELLVNYAYTSNINITMDNVLPIFEAANMLQVKPVEEACEKFLKDKLRSDTCLRTWALADKLSYTCLSAMARSYALKKFEAVCRTEQFLELPVDYLKMYITDDGLHVRNEERVLEAIIHWALHDLEERQRHLGEMLACVRFSHVNPSLIKDVTETDQVLSEVLGIEELTKEDGRHARPRQIHQEEIIVLGGATDKGESMGRCEVEANLFMYRLNLHGDIIDKKPMPRSLKHTESSAVCVVNNDIILTGGGVSPSQAYRYNSTQNSWTKLASLRKRRVCHGMAALHGQVYVVGGQDPFDDDREEPLSSVELYTEETGTWKKVKRLKLGVRNFGIAACCNNIYVFGGELDSTTIQCYNPSHNEWTVKTMELPEPAICVRACPVNAKIYLVGGSLSRVLRYDPQLDSYERMKAEPLKSWDHSSAFVCGSEIYITGGLSKLFHHYLTVPHARVQCYDMNSDTMTMGFVKDLPIPLCSHYAVILSK
ncbi:kelch-like protein 24 [Branchiostoma floridae]|uniref:Kelch-like protein 24 n=1 Tax=Branchiostoma floridae TaxID=7739 RepID=A0A9J7LNW6_BRAFL|nr:kelch-like protein 24 [Branchiostoma floridae]